MVNDKRDIEYEKTKIKTTKLKRDLGELKEKLKKAIADEKEANIFYKELINLAQRAEQRGTADKLKAILSQEQSHAEVDWRLLKDTEEAEGKFQKEYEESKKKEQVKEPNTRYGRR